MTARDMSVFDDLERQAQVFAAVRYIERNAARRKVRLALGAGLTSALAGVTATVMTHAQLLLDGGVDSAGSAFALSAMGTLPLLLGVYAYLSGLRYSRAVTRDLERLDPEPKKPLLGVIQPDSFFTWSSAKSE